MMLYLDQNAIDLAYALITSSRMASFRSRPSHVPREKVMQDVALFG
jgi:hypothetical protein